LPSARPLSVSRLRLVGTDSTAISDVFSTTSAIAGRSASRPSPWIMREQPGHHRQLR
jgi:hypothetical protein